MGQKIFLIFITYIVIVSILEFFVTKEKSIDFRRKQSTKFMKDGKFKAQMEEYFERKGKHVDKYKSETLTLQAGYNMKYGEFMVYKVVVGIIAGIIFGILFKNPFLGLVMMGLGSMIPGVFLNNKRNKRYATLNEQIGPMMFMLNKRYQSTGDFVKALDLTTEEYKGIEPMYTELNITSNEIAQTGEIKKSLDSLARRTGSYYLQLLSDYFEIAYEIGSDTSKELLNQAYEQFEEDRKMKELLDTELSQVVKESYIMIGSVPVFGVFSAVAMPDFLPVVTGTIIGKVAITIIILVLVLCIWFVNKFVNAPLE